MTELTAIAGRYGPIFDPTRSVILIASAGTGKTWRLVRRYLRIIATEDPRTGAAWARPEEVVAVTFTRAAAAEMRERVFAALTCPPALVGAGGIAADDPVLAEVVGAGRSDAAMAARHAARLGLAEHVAAAPIGTLHSLCAQLLAEFPELSNVAPDARALDPAEQSLELDAFVSSWLDRVLDEPDHLAHAGALGLLRAHPLAFVRRELRAMVDEREGLDPRWADPASVAASRHAWVAAQWREYLAHMQLALMTMAQASAVEASRTGGRPSAKLAELDASLRRLVAHMPSPDLGRIVADVDALVRLRPSKALGQAAPVLEQLHNIHRVQSTRRERRVLPDPRACLDPAQAGHVARWVALAEHARADWLASLQDRGRLRYDDLERLARALLDDPRARGHLRGRYRHVLVDEYQDINPLQAEIIERLVALCGPDEAGATLFFVGDPKQSIYRFRGADPEVFRRAVAGHAAELVRLSENRRSSPTLARFFMEMFPPLFAGVLPWANVTDLGRPWELARLRDIEDHAKVGWDGPIVAVRERDRMPGLAVDLLLRTREPPREAAPADLGGEGEATAADELAREPDRVAAWLRGLLDAHDRDAHAGEPDPSADPAAAGPPPVRLRARDCAILVPRWSLADEHRVALEARGIAADLAGGRGLLALPEVRDLINLVRLWADEHDELAALAVLRGPCLAISDLGCYVLARWPGVDRRIREADPDLPELADVDEQWAIWDAREPAPPSPGPQARPRRLREVLAHGRLDPARAIAALAEAGRILVGEDEDEGQARARLLAQLEADAAALEAGRDRLLARTRAAGARPTAELLADVVVEFQLEAHWLVGPRERRAVANAWRFVELVRGLEHDGPDLGRVVAWLDAGTEAAPEGLISPDADAVTITTWHGSKGKEWPVVVVAGLGDHHEHGARTSWSATPVPTLTGDPATQIVVPRIAGPHHGFVSEPDPIDEPCTNMLAPLEAAEAKRLLYVALTRARDRLLLSGEVDARAHVHFDDKPYLGLDRGFDMQALIGEPKPAYLCKRPIELLLAALDLPAARPGTAVIRPRAATWSLAHLRVIDDAMLEAGLARWRARAPSKRPALVRLPEPVAAAEPVAAPVSARARRRRPAAPSNQLSLFDAASLDARPSLEPPALRWRVGPRLQRWTPSAGRSPWSIADLRWVVPLPARRPALLDDEDPRWLGELFHQAMERWDFVGEPPRGSELDALVSAAARGRSPGDRRRIAAWLERCVGLVVADLELTAELQAARARDELFHEVDVEALISEAEGDHAIGGRIDLLWRGDDRRWHVLDYKVTSKVQSRAQMHELEWEYGPQLQLYRQALARWRPQGQPAALGRFGLWLATAGKAMWLV